MKINCIAVDDEPLALKKMENYISKVEFLNLVGLIDNGVDAVSFIRMNKVDLIFLDIQMSDLSGIGLLKSLTHRPIVILTTAYEEYALEGYEYSVTDYLLKPISFTRFMKAVNAAAEVYLTNTLTISSNFSGELKDKSLGHIFVKTSNKLQKVLLDDILYIEAMKDYVKIWTAKEKIVSLNNMKRFMEKLPADRFIRIHKSYAIAIDKIDAIKKNHVEIGRQDIPIGYTFRNLVAGFMR